MSIRAYLRRALLRAKLRMLLAAQSLLQRLLARRQSRPPASYRGPASAPPEMTLSIEDGVDYTPQRQAEVAACTRQAADLFLAYAVGKLRHEGALAPDWPTSVNVRVERNRVEWSLTSHSGHRFAASYPERRGPYC